MRTFRYELLTIFTILLVACSANAQAALGIPLDVPPKVLLEETPPKKAPKIWSGDFEFGLNGAEGNSRLNALRIGGEARRETEATIYKFYGVYKFAHANNEETENRSILKNRIEWLLPGKPWDVFELTNIEYDRFRAFDVRLGIHAGVGYQWVKTKTLNFKTSMGAGGSWEFGGPNNAFMPESIFGWELDYQFTKRQKITSIMNFYPEIDFGGFRFEGRLNYEILIDPTWNLTLRLGIWDRYDSTPEGRKPNDIEYFSTLLWKF